jgi:hypothetical protein
MPRIDRALRHTSARRSRPRPAAGRRLLTQSDFTYLGYYDFFDGSDGAFYGVGMTHRYVSGQFRLLLGSFQGGTNQHAYLRECTLPGSFGGTLSNGTLIGPVWPDTGNAATFLNGLACKHGFWWEAGEGRLWSNSAIDYPNLGIGQGDFTSCLWTRQVADDGTVSDHNGFWGLQGFGQRAHYGGVRKVPAWFQSAYSVGPYVSGFGGYTSLAAQGLGASYGPLLVFFPDPHGVYTAQDWETELGGITSAVLDVGADCRDGVSGTDWYSDYNGRALDRGVRATSDVTNYFDSGAYTLAGGESSAPTEWTSPAPNDPDGHGRWSWGDTHDGCCEWIDDDAGTRAAHGIVTVVTLGRGAVWYETSDLRFDNKGIEIHVYDPARVAECVAGSREPWDVRPANAWSATPSLEGFPTGYHSGSAQDSRHANGSTFDPTTGRLYVRVGGIAAGSPPHYSRIYVFGIGGG